LKPGLTVRETLEFWRTLFGGNGPIDPALRAWGLKPLSDLPSGILSAGQRRRVALARLSLASRPLWLLDEPTAPLDEGGSARVVAAIKEQARAGGITIVASHRDLDLGDAQVLDLDRTVERV
jgi:heme exporter protein A